MAAFNFPPSPSNGDTYTLNSVTYKYDGTKWVRYSAAVGAQGDTGSTGSQGAQGHQGNQGLQGAQAHIGTSAPGSPNNGDLWWESDTGDLSIYYDDGVGSPSAQWVDINTGPRGAQGGTGPTGAQGAQGHQGHQGAQGHQGHQGAAGAQGAQGSAGAQGAQGHQGHQGQTGSGAQGAQGNAGAQGAQGNNGAQGAQGSTGSATISSNSNNRVITGGSGTNLVGESSFTYDGNGMVDIEGTGAAGIQIKTPNNTDGGIYFRTGSSNPGAISYLHTSASETLNFRSGGYARMSIDGTTDSNNNVITLKNASYDNGILQYYNGGLYLKTGSSSGDRVISFMTAGSTRLRITNTGNIGLGGETSPIALLTLNKGSTGSNTTFTNAELIRLEGYDSTNSKHGIGFGRYNGGANGYKPAAFIGAATGTWASYTNCHLVFATRNTTGDDEPTERLRIENNGKVGIARTTNNAQTGDKNSIYDLSINRESSANTYDGLNKSLNVDNQYTVQTFRATNSNRSSISQWYDVAHFRAWDINARVIIQAGGTFTGDQINIDVQSSYNSALANGRSGPVLEVKRTEAHNGGRFTKVRIGCHNSNRQPVLQVYFNGGATHNSVGSVTVTVHDYGSNYGHGAHRGEAKWASPTTLNETWEELDIDGGSCDYFNTSTTPAFSVFKADNSNQIGSGTYAFNSQM